MTTNCEDSKGGSKSAIDCEKPKNFSSSPSQVATAHSPRARTKSLKIPLDYCRGNAIPMFGIAQKFANSLDAKQLPNRLAWHGDFIIAFRLSNLFPNSGIIILSAISILSHNGIIISRLNSYFWKFSGNLISGLLLSPFCAWHESEASGTFQEWFHA